jgi:hypothetical protein
MYTDVLFYQTVSEIENMEAHSLNPPLGESAFVVDSVDGNGVAVAHGRGWIATHNIAVGTGLRFVL